MNRLVAVAVALLFAAQPGAADAAKRVALIIGNSAYEHVPRLVNPTNDAKAFAERLKGLGFHVVEGSDLGFRQFRQTIATFVERIASADLALFYYAGHGLQVNGRNYMVPVDAKLATHIDLEFEAVPMDLILTEMEAIVETNLVFLDACRDNPLARNLARSIGTRSSAVGQGLARIGSGQGTLIAFATQPGNVALDGTSGNSPFTAALVKHLGTPGESLSDSMIRVRNEVIERTAGRQVPWEHSSLTGRVVLKERPKSTADPNNAVEIAYWNSIKDSVNPQAYKAYLQQFPSGAFASLAKLKIMATERRSADEARAGIAAATNAPEKNLAIAALDQSGAAADRKTDASIPGTENRALAATMQQELNRLGCSAGKVDGIWGAGSRRALENYGKHRQIKLASLDPSQALLRDLKAQGGRICPLVCGRGYETINGRCVAKRRQAKSVPGPERTTPASPRKQRRPTRATNNSAAIDGGPRQVRLCRSGVKAACRARCRLGYKGACRKLRTLR